MEISFITALKFIEISDPLGRGDKLDDITFISNDSSIIKELIPAKAIESIGNLEYDELLNAKTIIYSKEVLLNDVSPEDYLDDRLFFVQSFLSSIWLEMDNSIDFELGFVFFEKDREQGISSNYLAVSYTNSQVEHTISTLSRSKLKDIRSFYRDKLMYVKNSYKERGETQLLKKNSRFEIAFYHVQGARSESDIGVKISKYCSALEALFSTSQAELSHQLSERLAFCISKTPEERLDNYKKSKKAYGVRSKVVHGSRIKDRDLPELKETSLFCDSSLRTIMTNILTDENLYKNFSSSNEVLDKYMLNLIFDIKKDPSK